MHCTVGDKKYIILWMYNCYYTTYSQLVAQSNFSKVGMSCSSGVVLGVLVACQ